MLTPTADRARIEVLDVLRGIAILLIFLLNIPLMGGTFYQILGDPRLLGWTRVDQVCYWFQDVALVGTQRGMLQLLFGAGAVILLGRVMRPDGPVEVADLYFRRTLWLMAFGLFDIFVLFWIGDILLIYSIAALFLFPFRRLGPRALIALTLVGLAVPVGLGARGYWHARTVHAAALRADAKQARHEPLAAAERQALATRTQEREQARPDPAKLAAERAAHAGSLPAYQQWWVQGFVMIAQKYYLIIILEAFTTMLLGMALFKLGIIQGERPARFYLGMAVLAYLPGLTLRAINSVQTSDFDGSPHIGQITDSVARLAVTLGHIAVVNLLMQGATGRAVLAPFRAVGRVAFSTYLMQNFLGMWVLFPNFGLNLWGKCGWTVLTLIAIGVVAAQVVLANLWLQFFAIGPMEWIWRSLAYLRVQPIRHRPAEPVATALPA